MTSKIFLALVIGASVTFGTLATTGASDAAELRKSAHTQQAAQTQGGSRKLTDQPRRTRGEVVASQDFASECNLHGGGASTDPDGFERCTSPDGDNIVVPFP